MDSISTIVKDGPTPISCNIECPAGPVVQAKTAGKFRTYLPQILATTAKNLLLLGIGAATAFPTILIGSKQELGQTIQLDKYQASWIASIGFIGQVLGSSISGWVTEPFGRKRAMIFLNVPHIVAWIMLYFASSTTELYVAALLLGFGSGVLEAPILTYVGEICQPAIRGVLLSLAMFSAQLGFLVVFSLGAHFNWRISALVCLSVPLSAVVAISLIPETPAWLLSKNRNHDALRSLQWLRGWVSEEAVRAEYRELERCNSMCNTCPSCRNTQTKCTHSPPSSVQKWKSLFQLGTRRPFVLMAVLFFLNIFSGMSAIRPYMLEVFDEMKFPIKPKNAAVCIPMVSLIANVICTCVVKIVGKRKMYLFSLAACALSCYGLGIYAAVKIPTNYYLPNSHSNETGSSPENYFAFVMVMCLAFFSNLGVYPTSFIMLCEVFPLKTRGMATGLVMALFYILNFVSAKTFLDMDNTIRLYGIFALYGTFSVFGVLYMLFFMPNTENRTLEEVEQYFSDPHRREMDRRIGTIIEANPTNASEADEIKVPTDDIKVSTEETIEKA